MHTDGDLDKFYDDVKTFLHKTLSHFTLILRDYRRQKRDSETSMGDVALKDAA